MCEEHRADFLADMQRAGEYLEADVSDLLPPDGCATTRPYASLGTLYKRQCDYAKAASYFGRAIASDNTPHFALYEAADCLAKLGAGAEEIEKNLSSLFASPSEPLNRTLLADVLLSRRMADRAEKHVEALLSGSTCPTDARILSGKRFFWTRDYARVPRTRGSARYGSAARAHSGTRGFGGDAVRGLSRSGRRRGHGPGGCRGARGSGRARNRCSA